MTAPSKEQNDEFALGMIRLLSRRLKETDEHVTLIGTALSQGRMPGRVALMLADQIAPGCMDAIHGALFEGISPDQLRDMTNPEAPRP